MISGDTLLWAWLFFKETITIFILSGAVLFLTGIFILSYKEKQVSGKPYNLSYGNSD